jgi:transcriptional regulator with XRE-family HTH domain
MEAMHRLKKAGYSRADIANALNVSEQVVGMWERGQRFPSADNFAQLVQLGNEKGLNLMARDFVAPDPKHKQH